mgnify:CR=1 FL=1
MSIGAIFTGLEARFVGDATLVSLGRKLYFVKPIGDPVKVIPHVLVRFSAGGSTEQSGFGCDIEQWTVEFVLFTRGDLSTSLPALYDALVARMDYAALTIAGYSLVMFERIPGLSEQPQQDAEGGFGFMGVAYQLMIQRTTPVTRYA